MKVHLRQIKYGQKHFEGEEDVHAFGFEVADAEVDGLLSYSLDVGLSGGGLWAVGHLVLPLQLCCVKCLRKFAWVSKVDDFAMQINLEGKESVDLTPWIREDIFLSLPPYPRCDVDGGQQCPACFPSDFSERSSENSTKNVGVWAALDKLKKKK